MTMRQDKVAALLSEQAAVFLQSISNHSALITVTRADVSPDLRKATIFVTVLPTEKEEQAVAFANRHAAELRDYIKPRLNMRRLPFFSFELDHGERNRQHIDEISREL